MYIRPRTPSSTRYPVERPSPSGRDAGCGSWPQYTWAHCTDDRARSLAQSRTRRRPARPTPACPRPLAHRGAGLLNDTRSSRDGRRSATCPRSTFFFFLSFFLCHATPRHLPAQGNNAGEASEIGLPLSTAGPVWLCSSIPRCILSPMSLNRLGGVHTSFAALSSPEIWAPERKKKETRDGAVGTSSTLASSYLSALCNGKVRNAWS